MTLFEQQQNEFSGRHIGPSEAEISSMLAKIGIASLDELINQTIPASIRLKEPMQTGGPMSEFEYLSSLKK